MNIFDFAIDIEKRCRKFYRELARTADFEGAKTVFNMLAADEEELIAKFRAMKATTEDYALEGSIPLSEEIKALFVRFQREAGTIDNDVAAYRFAIDVEKEICRVYEDIAKRESRPAVKALLQKIATEERRELESLRLLFDFVNAPNEFFAWGEFSNLGEFRNYGRTPL